MLREICSPIHLRGLMKSIYREKYQDMAVGAHWIRPQLHLPSLIVLPAFCRNFTGHGGD